MSDIPADVLVPRGEAVRATRQHMGEVRALERERRIRRLGTLIGPWALSLVLVGLVAADRYERAHHPFPEPEIRVAVVRGSITVAVPVKDLTEGEEIATLRTTIANYVAARESYCFTCRAKFYKRVSAVSAPEERARYQAVILDSRNPDNPEVLYGTGLHAGVADVDPENVEVTQDPDSPNYFTAVFPVDIMSQSNPVPRRVTKYARMQWLPAGASMDATARTAYSPLGVGCWFYASHTMEAPR